MTETTNDCPKCTVEIEVIERNSAKCDECGDEIDSKHRHDFRTCKCGNLCVDGGKDYRKRLFRTSFTETSVYHNEPYTFPTCGHRGLDEIMKASAGMYEDPDEDPNCLCNGMAHDSDCELA